MSSPTHPTNLVEGRKYTSRNRLEDEFDYVIVGSGAAGATAARVLCESGARVAVVEEGPALEPSRFGDQIWPGMQRLFRNAGGFVARGRAFIPVLQGRCLGGSTVINSAIMWRIPDDVFDDWRDLHGIGEGVLPRDELHRCWSKIEEELHVRPVTDEALGHNVLMEQAAAKLGVSGHRTRRGDTGCRGSARCVTGCPHGAKQSMLVSYLPLAASRGTTLFTDARVERIELSRTGRAVAVRGSLLSGRRVEGVFRRKFRLVARKAVLVGASAIQTPPLLARSGIKNRHLGEHLQAHPGSPVLGLFDRPIDPWVGATQGFDVDEHRRHRFKIETISLPPEMIVARLPGIGREYIRNIELADHITTWGIQLRAWTEGRVRPMPLGLQGTDVTFDPLDRDMKNLHRALRFTAEMFFAAGARQVLLPIHGMPERIGPDQLHLLDDAPMDPGAYSWILSHMFGTARMGLTAREGVVGPDFAVHGTENLYVIDSSVFPSNLGVNPQEPIMGLAMYAAERIANRH